MRSSFTEFESTHTPMTTPLISIRSVGKQFPGVRALHDVSFEIMPGELRAIMGENGAGKSTLMKILSGVYPDYEGELWLAGERVQFSGTRDAEAAGVSIIHQELNLVEQLSVAANIFLGREKTWAFGILAQRQMDAAAAELLSQLDATISPRALVSSLRVGDQQLVEIAKALSLRSKILIMDEPTSALTESEVARLDRVIAKLRSRGVTILYISHKMDEVFRLSDRITVLRDGRLVQTLKTTETNPREIAHLMVGREIEHALRPTTAKIGPVVLEVRGLSLPWTGHARGYRLRNINLELRKGEIVGIAGLMGAGRTELLETIFGASTERPSGRILLNGNEVEFHHPAEAKRAGIALVTEDRKRLGLFSHLNVRENITICHLAELARMGMIQPRREQAATRMQIQTLGVKTAGSEAAITNLSGGNQQKCILARWLMIEPQVLLLDDPTRGVDVGAKAELYRLMDRLAEQGLAMLVTSSELPELLTISDRILVLCEGELTGEFTRAEATEQKIMEAATTRKVA
jgi:ABC-type sugar transport system ATPase subunit